MLKLISINFMLLINERIKKLAELFSNLNVVAAVKKAWEKIKLFSSNEKMENPKFCFLY